MNGCSVAGWLRTSSLGCLGALALLCVPAVASAQALPAVNAGLPTREEIDPGRRQAAPPPARLKVEGDIERSSCALADPAYADVRITLTKATFNNLGPVDPAVLAPAYAEYVGIEKPFATVCDIRDRAATILRDLGYVAAVMVPVQRIENGAVQFEVLYARLSAVRVRGDVGRNEAALQRYLSNLELGKPFNRREAERYLLLARDLPGLDVRLALRPAGTAPGDMIGEISVRRIPFEIDASVQNLAPPETGRWSGQLRAQAYGLTGLGDRTTVSISSTADFAEQQVLQIGHDMALGGDGLRLGGRFTYAWTHPTLAPGTPEVRARTLYANAEASYPVLRRQSGSLSAALGFDFVNQNVRFGALPLSEDRLRVAYLRLDANALDLRGIGPDGSTGWQVNGTLEIRKGLSVFDASANCLAAPLVCAGAGVVPPSLVDGDPTATTFRFTGLAELHLLRNISFVFQPRAQVSTAPLFSFEQYAAGNYTVGRGYVPGALTGDDGLGMSSEIRYDRVVISSKAQVSAQPYAFVDHSWVWDRNRLAGSQPEQLTSVGAGARLLWSGRARLDVAVAVPVRTIALVKSGDVRFLMTLSTRLLPWEAR
jgi:hemolysin activation/secretion protein